MEPGLICYECVGTHPGCGLNDFDSRWYWGKICPRSDDRCVKVGKSEWKSNHLQDTVYLKRFTASFWIYAIPVLSVL